MLGSGSGPRAVELYCGFRDLADVCGASACDALESRFPGRFSFTPIISQPMACTAVGLSGFSSGGVGGLAGEGLAGGGLAASLVVEGEAPTPAAPSFVQGRVTTAVPGLLGEEVSRCPHPCHNLPTPQLHHPSHPSHPHPHHPIP